MMDGYDAAYMQDSAVLGQSSANIHTQPSPNV